MELRKRASMEANKGEVRRIHVVYFLCRMGHVEQPHLIRVHHLAGDGGVFLRDVKRWLGELRGKDMAEAFSWSYKRKYRTGYVWQDLVDDDLITPISDNEYVLQGSQIIPTGLFDNSSGLGSSSCSTKWLRENFPGKEQMNGESPPCDSERSTVTDDGDSMKVEEDSKKDLETAKKGIEEEEEEEEEIEGLLKNQYSSLHAKLLNNKKEEKDKEKDSMEKEGGPTATSTVSSSPSFSFTKSKSYSSGASHVLRQLITCGAVDTNDAVLIKNRSPKDPPKNDAVICRDDRFGGSARVFRTSWDGQLQIRRHHAHQPSRKSLDESRKKRQKESGDRKVAATYKPMSGPNCSQCGKAFRPEKMQAHMKSCRGLKALGKTASTSDKTTSSKSTTTRTSDKESASQNYLLTN